jgi:hypothetical protein
MEESKVVSSHPFMVNFKDRMRPFGLTLLLFLFIFILALVTPSSASAQFTLTPAQLYPSSVDPGGSATATIALTYTSGFTGTVDLSCSVTSSQITTDLPACGISPATETASSTPSLTITTTGTTPAGAYEITVTGVSGSTTVTATLFLNVADLAQDYTITVFPSTAIPSPVVAGSVATSTVTIAAIGSYTGTVTLSCLSITPVVTGAPVCSFDPPTVTVTGGTPPTSTLTLTTFTNIGTPTNSGSVSYPRSLYALWLAFPALMLVAAGTVRTRRKKFLGIFLLLAVACSVLLLPACGTSSTNNASNQVTPNETYTFTLTGSDTKGVGPSSTSSSVVTLVVKTG